MCVAFGFKSIDQQYLKPDKQKEYIVQMKCTLQVLFHNFENSNVYPLKYP